MKQVVKYLINAIFILGIFPLYLFHWIISLGGNKDRSFWGFSQFLSLFPGIPGNYLRKGFYRLTMTFCDKDCAISFGTIFSQVDTEIGKGVYIGPCCNIGRCKIEDYCTLGSGVHIMSGKQQHNFSSTLLDTVIREQGGIFEKVIIGEDTWIGNGL